MADKMTTEQKAACFDKLHELMEMETPFISIQTTVSGKTLRGFYNRTLNRYRVNHVDCGESFMDMLIEFERRVNP